MDSYEKIAKILRTDKQKLVQTAERLSAVTGKNDVFDEIADENEEHIRDRMMRLGVARDATAKELYDALISKIEADDVQIFECLGRPECHVAGGCQTIAEVAKKAVNPPSGFFMKHEKAREFLIKEPPKKVMEFLGYATAEAMLAKENLLEVMSALRFIEGSEWLNNVFFRQYETLTPGDFEEREIVVHALSEKWTKESEKFVVKKKHNISHLKEMGVVFVIPTFLGISGEILRMFALIMHYLHEIPFYAQIFRDIAKDEHTFSKNFTSLLRGDVIESRPAMDHISVWLVIQRYLAKEDENDWHLFVPHVNPEAIHWMKAEGGLEGIGAGLDGVAKELAFWQDLGWVGDFFKDDTGVDILVSFNLVDTVMSLVKQKENIKYLYHHQEALWNRIFVKYFGEEELYSRCRGSLLKGYFEI